jgi:hypothetical protein
MVFGCFLIMYMYNCFTLGWFVERCGWGFGGWKEGRMAVCRCFDYDYKFGVSVMNDDDGWYEKCSVNQHCFSLSIIRLTV